MFNLVFIASSRVDILLLGSIPKPEASLFVAALTPLAKGRVHEVPLMPLVWNGMTVEGQSFLASLSGKPGAFGSFYRGKYGDLWEIYGKYM